MNILLLGSGGREHALAWKLSQSKLLTKLYISPGNAGTSQCGTNITLKLNDFPSIKKCCLENKISMLVVGPEDPLVAGIHDFFLNDPELKNIPVIGPQKEGARLEGSKAFSKRFMEKYKIPTARYKNFTEGELDKAYGFLKTLSPPYVLKADGLAAGKGVLILDSIEESKAELSSMLSGKSFGNSGKTVVIEEFLSGIEVSVFVLTDGESYKILPEAKDYKRISEGDQGLNTGGMGAVSPVPFATKEFMKKVEDRIIVPTIEGLKKENIPYSGFIFFGLIKVNEEPMVIEYNCRMGDPETEAVIPRIKSDLLELFIAVGEKKLSSQKIIFEEQHAATVMLVSGGYPGDYEKGKTISGLNEKFNGFVFHAGTTSADGTIVTNGGRVIACTSLGNTPQSAMEKVFEDAEKINYEGRNFRRDIGKDMLKLMPAYLDK